MDSLYSEQKMINKNDLKIAAADQIKYNVLLQWVEIMQKGFCFKDYFKANGIEKVAIYGFGELGELLFSELVNEKFDVSYIIDKNENVKVNGVQCITPEYEGEDTMDLIIITLATGIECIKGQIKLNSVKVVSIRELLFKMYVDLLI